MKKNTLYFHALLDASGTTFESVAAILVAEDGHVSSQVDRYLACTKSSPLADQENMNVLESECTLIKSFSAFLSEQAQRSHFEVVTAQLWPTGASFIESCAAVQENGVDAFSDIKIRDLASAFELIGYHGTGHEFLTEQEEDYYYDDEKDADMILRELTLGDEHPLYHAYIAHVAWELIKENCRWF